MIKAHTYVRYVHTTYVRMYARAVETAVCHSLARWLLLLRARSSEHLRYRLTPNHVLYLPFCKSRSCVSPFPFLSSYFRDNDIERFPSRSGSSPR